MGAVLSLWAGIDGFAIVIKGLMCKGLVMCSGEGGREIEGKLKVGDRMGVEFSGV